jgi:hypothetical protein
MNRAPQKSPWTVISSTLLINKPELQLALVAANDGRKKQVSTCPQSPKGKKAFLYEERGIL